MPTINTLKPHQVDPAIEQMADHAAAGVDSALQATRSATDHALDSLKSGVEGLRQAGPAALSRAAAQVEELTRQGMDRARAAGVEVKKQVTRAGDKSVDYIRDEPVKSVLMAAAAGAVIAALVGWSMRGRLARA